MPDSPRLGDGAEQRVGLSGGTRGSPLPFHLGNRFVHGSVLAGDEIERLDSKRPVFTLAPGEAENPALRVLAQGGLPCACDG
jgi:hypothetical protein